MRPMVIRPMCLMKTSVITQRTTGITTALAGSSTSITLWSTGKKAPTCRIRSSTTATGYPPRASIHVNSQIATQTDTIDPGAENNHHAQGASVMPVYEVIVGNVGSVHHGKSRATALATYESYV